MANNHEKAPDWAREAVHVVEPDAEWPTLAERYIDELNVLLGRRLVGPVLHVGSTAVPGLAAKPIIDLQALAVDPELVIDACQQALKSSLWHVVPRDLDQRPWRWFLVRSDVAEMHRLAHLHLMEVGEPRWQEQLTFRDRLRASDELVRQYARLKVDAAAAHPSDREAYTRAKDEFVQRIICAG